MAIVLESYKKSVSKEKNDAKNLQLKKMTVNKKYLLRKKLRFGRVHIIFFILFTDDIG